MYMLLSACFASGLRNLVVVYCATGNTGFKGSFEVFYRSFIAKINGKVIDI